jgi:hypothetical protein
MGLREADVVPRGGNHGGGRLPKAAKDKLLEGRVIKAAAKTDNIPHTKELPGRDIEGGLFYTKNGIPGANEIYAEKERWLSERNMDFAPLRLEQYSILAYKWLTCEKLADEKGYDVVTDKGDVHAAPYPKQALEYAKRMDEVWKDIVMTALRVGGAQNGGEGEKLLR